MSNYIKAVDYSVKDGLTTGDPDKIVKGTEIDDEFDAIAIAIQTKADLVSPAFLGTPTAPTATATTNNTQLATTAFVQAVKAATLAAVYPVGSIYTNATSSTNPATLLGFGTWSAFGAGRVPVGFNASDALFNAAEKTGGSKNAIVVSHTHTATSTVTDPGHTHGVWSNSTDTGSVVRGWGNTGSTSVSALNVTSTGYRTTLGGNNIQGIETKTTGVTAATTVASTGSSGTNANLPPYITVYMWKRTA